VAAHDLGDADPQVQARVPVLVDTFRGAYAAARKAVHDAELDPDLVKAFRFDDILGVTDRVAGPGPEVEISPSS
jgi:hypothetical protein